MRVPENRLLGAVAATVAGLRKVLLPGTAYPLAWASGHDPHSGSILRQYPAPRSVYSLAREALSTRQGITLGGVVLGGCYHATNIVNLYKLQVPDRGRKNRSSSKYVVAVYSATVCYLCYHLFFIFSVGVRGLL